MWHGRTVSVILPTYNERDSIRQSIEDIAGDRRGRRDSRRQQQRRRRHLRGGRRRRAAREVHEPRQGYGNAIQRGFREATGDLLIVSEPDGTFLGRDILKLLAYADDFDVVYGSRTARMFIWRGANMGLFLRWGNWAVAKLMEFLFNSHQPDRRRAARCA